MLYLITFDHAVYTTPVSVGEFLVRQEDGESFDQLIYAPVEWPINADDVLKPALRNGFRHPDGLLVDASLVDVMTTPQHLEDAAAAQQQLHDQLAELQIGRVPVSNASHVAQQDQMAREARLDHQEAVRWANTARKKLLERPVKDELQQHWDTLAK